MNTYSVNLYVESAAICTWAGCWSKPNAFALIVRVHVSSAVKNLVFLEEKTKTIRVNGAALEITKRKKTK